jgi:hypothetical protein
MITNAKINYNLNYVSGAGIAYNQCLKITQKDFDYILSKIKNELEYIKVTPNYNSYEKMYFGYPIKGKYCDKEFYYNLTTSKFIKSLLSEKIQKRYLLDRNSYIKIID